MVVNRSTQNLDCTRTGTTQSKHHASNRACVLFIVHDMCFSEDREFSYWGQAQGHYFQVKQDQDLHGGQGLKRRTHDLKCSRIKPADLALAMIVNHIFAYDICELSLPDQLHAALYDTGIRCCSLLVTDDLYNSPKRRARRRMELMPEFCSNVLVGRGQLPYSQRTADMTDMTGGDNRLVGHDGVPYSFSSTCGLWM